MDIGFGIRQQLSKTGNDEILEAIERVKMTFDALNWEDGVVAII
jgi:hypothetical protein